LSFLTRCGLLAAVLTAATALPAPAQGRPGVPVRWGPFTRYFDVGNLRVANIQGRWYLVFDVRARGDFNPPFFEAFLTAGTYDFLNPVQMQPSKRTWRRGERGRAFVGLFDPWGTAHRLTGIELFVNEVDEALGSMYPGLHYLYPMYDGRIP